MTSGGENITSGGGNATSEGGNATGEGGIATGGGGILITTNGGGNYNKWRRELQQIEEKITTSRVGS